ncbi:enoyl-CoA hydratase/isomerase family protein [Paucibacter sp. R3-3]|uniref:Enoyl-CoA hydratase/isomerase family protein n=1 Tax=Roseateles agri TaxID=3098619 RepID=A0ABU5DJ78_9BURK|nr:enoyl-CoA hydratase/isomerase family protein [Paucibacter sp. R3-3]MDY0746335.1 enoyl-CoA hydratase/isomerase family protein [Paucibacter sp. R3-3]
MQTINTTRGVHISHADDVLTFTLDSPENGNEVSGAMMDAMLATLGELAHRPTSRVLRLRANGPVFCTGRERAGRDAAAIHAEVARLLALKQALRTTRLITVAEVQGDAFGFGMGLAMLCDFTLVASTARLAFPEMRKGLPPAAIMAYLGNYGLPKAVFPLVLLAREFTPARALAAGLVTEVCAPQVLASSAAALVDSILALDAVGVRDCKSFFLEASEASVAQNFLRANDALTLSTLRLQSGS